VLSPAITSNWWRSYQPFSYWTADLAWSGAIPSISWWSFVSPLSFSKLSNAVFKLLDSIKVSTLDLSFPKNFSVIFLWIKTVRDSFNQKSSQVLHVTRFPVQEWATSWIAVATYDLSPVIIVGDTNVRRGFSIPPNGKEGGRTSKLYSPQA